MRTDLQVEYATLTNQGERAVNEDSLGTLDNRIFVLCDGLGGHGNGDKASKHVVSSILSTYKSENAFMEDAILAAQNSLLQKQVAEGAEDSMKTTVTCLELNESTAKFGHVGDSRIYVFERHKVRQRSLDHSVPQMLVQRGEISEKDIRHHEDRSRLLRVMGIPWDTPKYQICEGVPLGKKTSFLLCSDGFWELIDEKQMGRLLRQSKTPAEWLKKMEEVIIAKGRGTNMDNYSAIGIFIR